MINNLHFKKYLNLKTWRPYLLIFIIGFLLYSQTLMFKFTYLDDNDLILNKIDILQNTKNIGSFFSTDVFRSVPGNKFYYRPLLNLSFSLDAYLGGALPFFYHLDNIFLHLIASFLIFYLLYLITRRKSLAFFLALIFLVHPVLSQAVAWVPGRNDSLLTIFVLSSFLFFLKFLKKPVFSFYLSYLFFFFLALLTKETAVVLPVLLIFYFSFIDKGKSSKNDRRLIVLGSLAPLFIWFLMRHLALGSEPVNYFSILKIIIHNSSVFLLYLGNLFFPINLAVLPVLKDSTLFYGLLSFILLALVWIFSKQKRNNYLIFGYLWFFIFLIPSLSVFNKAPYFLEHRLYLSFFGFLIVLSEIDFIKNLDFKKKKVWMGSLVVLIILSGITFYHSQNFRNRLVFWQSAVRTSPHSPLAQKNLGVMYYFNGNYFQAIKHYNLALNINPQEIMVHNNLGVIYMNQKKYQLAKQEFNAELKNNPGYDKALANLQDLSSRQKQLK